MLSCLGCAWFRKLAAIVQRLTIPGIVLHYATRKRCINDLANGVITLGINQTVVLGAGFDAFGAELRERSDNLRVWELDHPATQRCKRRALASMGITSVNLISADLTKVGLKQTLTGQADLRPGEKTLWLAEGLLMYFAAETVSRIFEDAAAKCARGSRFIFTFMQPDRRKRIRFQNQTLLVDWWLQFGHEPFRWGSSPESLPEFIKPWRVLEVFGSDDLEQLNANRPNQPTAVGEMICLAEL